MGQNSIDEYRNHRSFILVGWISVAVTLLASVSSAQADDALPPHALQRLEGEGKASIWGLAFSPDGKWLATRDRPGDASLRIIRIWDTTTGQIAQSLKTFQEDVVDLDFASGGSILITGTPELPGGVQFWDVRTGQLLHSVEGGHGRIQMTGDGKKVAVLTPFGARDLLRIHRVQDAMEVQRLPLPSSYRAVFSADGSRLLSLRTQVRSVDIHVLDLSTGTLLMECQGCPVQPSVMALSDDGRTVAASYRESSRTKSIDRILLWDAAIYDENPQAAAGVADVRANRPPAPTVYRLEGHTSRITSLAFSPDGRYLASGSLDKTVRIWEVATGRLTHTFEEHDGAVLSICFDPSGTKLAVGSSAGTVIVWDTTPSRKSFLPSDELDETALTALWHDLASDEASKGFQAMGLLAGGREKTLNWLTEQLESTVAPIRKDRIHELIGQLDDPNYVIRHRATEELKKLRDAAAPLLLAALQKGSSPEATQRIRRLLKRLVNTPRFTLADRRRLLRVIRALEPVPSDSSRDCLQMIAQDFPLPDIAAKAQAVLDRWQRVR